MGEVLSQEEIDSLLSALSSGEVDVEEMQNNTNEKQVKNYDFKRPAKFSKEHLRTLELIFEHYGRLVSTNLPVYLRKNVQVNVASSETVTFSEFTNALSNPVVLGIINFQPLSGNIICEITSNVAYAILDRMLGGQGAPLEKLRDYSEIELGILDKIMTMCTQLLREPWKNVIDISPILERIETNPQFAQIIAPNEMIAIVTMNITLGDVEGFMNICIPYLVLEPIMSKLTTTFWVAANISKEEHPEHEDMIRQKLRKTKVPVIIQMGQFDIQLLDADDNPCEDGEEGSLTIMDVKNHPPVGLFTGYYHNPEMTEEKLGGIGYNTGDVLWRDSDGYFRFIGRNDDVIKCSGYRIGPFEVESALVAHDAVVECAITGAPDPVRGQVVKATVVLAKGYEPSPELTKELQNHVKHMTAPYKYPRVIEYVAELPKTVGGKIKRAQIRHEDETAFKKEN